MANRKSLKVKDPYRYVDCPALYWAIGGNFGRTTLQRLYGKFIEKRNNYLRKLLFYYRLKSQLLQ